MFSFLKNILKKLFLFLKRIKRVDVNINNSNININIEDNFESEEKINNEN